MAAKRSDAQSAHSLMYLHIYRRCAYFLCALMYKEALFPPCSCSQPTVYALPEHEMILKIQNPRAVFSGQAFLFLLKPR